MVAGGAAAGVESLSRWHRERRYGCPFGNGFCSHCSHYELGECRARGLLGGCEYLHLDTWDGQVRHIPSQAPYKLVGGARKGCCPNATPCSRLLGRRPTEVAEFHELGHLGWAAASGNRSAEFGNQFKWGGGINR